MTSVVIPVYNDLDGVKKTLKALELQTKKIFYVIIVDDCSTKCSTADYQFNLDRSSLNGIVIRTPQNGGCGQARQTGLDFIMSRPMFDSVMFIDAGDYPFPFYVEFLTNELKKTGSDIMCSSFYRDFKGSLITEIDQNNNVWMHGKIFSLKFLKEHNIHFFTECRVNEDILFFRMCKVYNPKIMTLPYQTMLWKQDPNSTTNEGCGRNMIVHNNPYCARLVDIIELELEQEKKNFKNIMDLFQILYIIDQKEKFYYDHKRYATDRIMELFHNQKLIDFVDDKFIRELMKTSVKDDEWYAKETVYDWLKFYKADKILEKVDKFGKRDDI